MSKFDILEIKDPSFLKKLSYSELYELSDDIRAFLIQSVSKTGGHLSSNLGIVELTVALHYVFDSPKDKILFDVGHQAYVHKLLTGRAPRFSTLRKFQGLSGFQKRDESIHDVWEAGHSSTALSGALGMAYARDLDGEHYDIIPVIGDAAMSSGESFEALNHLGYSNKKVIVVLNDNQMSISKNVGAFSEFLSDVRTSHLYNHAKNDYVGFLLKFKWGKAVYKSTRKFKDFIKDRLVDSKIFGEFGVDYIGPIDGHNYRELILAFQKAKSLDHSVVVHVVTTKGKGYAPAEQDSIGHWHGVSPFDVTTGKSKSDEGLTYSAYVADCVHEFMASDKNIVTITPAMITGSKLNQIFKDYPDRAYDVGIAEEHALTFAAGLAVSGKKPFIAIYSSFMQRAYDQINHDLARMNLGAVIAIDRAGLVGADGETHHGVFDPGILKPIPNVILFAPSCKEEVDWFLDYSFHDFHHVHCLRFSKAKIESRSLDPSGYAVGKWQLLHQPSSPKAIFITYGYCVNDAFSYIQEHKLDVILVNACFLKPYDKDMIIDLGQMHLPIYIYETDLKQGGLSMDIEHVLYEHHIFTKLHTYGIEDHYVKQGSIDELLTNEGLNLKEVLEKVGKDIHE